MRQINIKQLKSNLCKELQSLPFEITKYGKVFAVVGGHNSINKVVTSDNKSNKGSHNDNIEDNLEKITNCNNKTKATIPTGGRQDYFKPCPK